jgi:hypothetical protein
MLGDEYKRMKQLGQATLVMILTSYGTVAETCILSVANANKALASDQSMVSTSYGGPKATPAFPQDCPLVVGFGSYGAGIDHTALTATLRLLKVDQAVRSVDHYHWGREGEVSVCINTRSSEDTKRLFYEIKRLFPAIPRGPLSLRTKIGMTHSVG